MKIFFKKKGGLGLVSLSHFLHGFWRKIFLTLYAIKWLTLIAWLSLFLEILGNICITITCFPVCDVKKFEITFSFLIKPFSYDQNIRTTKSAFKTKQKSFFIVFKKLSVVRKCLRLESGSLNSLKSVQKYRRNLSKLLSYQLIFIKNWLASFYRIWVFL